jgi:hypothetical protein
MAARRLTRFVLVLRDAGLKPCPTPPRCRAEALPHTPTTQGWSPAPTARTMRG